MARISAAPMGVSASDPTSLTLDGIHHSSLPAPPRSPQPPSQSRQSVVPNANFSNDAAQDHPQCLRDPEKAGGGAMDVEEMTLPLPSSHPISATIDHKTTPWGKEPQPVNMTEKSPGIHQQSPSSPPESRRASSASSGWVRYSSTSFSSAHERSIASSDLRYKSTYVWRVLIYLTCFNLFVCLFNCAYTLLALVVLLFVHPVKTLVRASTASFAETLTSRLAPQLAWHLRFMYPCPHPVPAAGDLSAAKLVAVHLASPLLAVPVGAMATAVAFVWLYSEVLLGDKSEEAGCEYRSFLWVRQRWEGFVLAALKRKELVDSVRSGYTNE